MHRVLLLLFIPSMYSYVPPTIQRDALHHKLHSNRQRRLIIITIV